MKGKNAAVVLCVAAAVAMSFLFGMFCGGRTAAPVLPPAEPTARTEPDRRNLLDLNTATAEELATLPGIGEKLAQSIVEYREAHGGIRSVYELQGIYGIGEYKMKRIAPYLRITRP